MTADTESETILSALAAPARPKMSKEIAGAIVSVCKGIKGTLEKDAIVKSEGKNDRSYRYVSVDQFYEMAGPLMAEAGLFLIGYEVSTEVVVRQGKWGPTNWLSCVFDFVLYHESGVDFGPITRTIQVVASGPQAYASAQSYLEKYLLRNLFKIATYDPETVEEHGKDGLPPPRDTGPTRYGAEKSAERCAAMLAELAVLTARGAVVVWGHKHDAETNLLTDEDGEKIIKAYEAKRAEIETADAAKGSNGN
jgi:hypothetical protein